MLSVAMVVKNEVETLERSIASVRDYVDYVAVGIDAMSSDGSRELAEKLADKVVNINLSKELEKKESIDDSHEWGFSKARNMVFDACPEESWRLVLDGHETIINPEKMERIVEEASEADCDGVEIRMNFEPDDNGIGQTTYLTARLMGPSVRYKNSLHNVAGVRRMYTTERVIVEHRKKDQNIESKQERDVQRSDSNINGFKKKLEENPKDTRSWFYLGNAYKENGMYYDAILAYQEYIELGGWRDERWHAHVNMGTCYARMGNTDEARNCYARAVEQFPAMAEAYYYLADLAYSQKKYREAQVWLEKCIELDMPYTKMFVNPKIYASDRYDKLAMVYQHTGEYAKAIEQAEIAYAATKNPRILNNITIWKKWIDDHSNSGERYDKIWGDDDKPSMLEMERISIMAEGLGERKKVLDIGCGPGWIMDELRGFPYYYGIDISKYARYVIEEKGGYVFESLDGLPAMDKKFDGCVLGEVLEHIEDDEGFLENIKGYLCKGAVVVVSVPRFVAMYDPAHVRDYTGEELRRVLSTLGKPESLGVVGPWTMYRCVVE